MLARTYTREIMRLIDEFATREEDHLTQAATLAANAVVAGGRLHHFDTGHMRKEPIRRAGGFLGLHLLDLEVNVEHRLPAGREEKRTLIEQQYIYDREELAPLLVEKSHLEPGDVLIQVSNSGKEPFTVGVGVEAKKRGVHLIGVTSVDFSKSLEPRHSSGKRLFEIADVVIDMGAPLADAVLEVDGIDTPVAATSGTLTAVALWSLMAEMTEALVARDMTPAIYRSVNLPNGFAFNREQEERYRHQGI